MRGGRYDRIKHCVVSAVRRQPVDRIPRGELAVEPGFTANFLADVEKPMSAMEKEIYVRNALGFDFVNMHEFPKQLLGYAEDGGDGERNNECCRNWPQCG